MDFHWKTGKSPNCGRWEINGPPMVDWHKASVEGVIQVDNKWRTGTSSHCRRQQAEVDKLVEGLQGLNTREVDKLVEGLQGLNTRGGQAEGLQGLNTREMDKLKACRDSIPERWTSWRLAGTQYQRDGQAEGLQGLNTRGGQAEGLQGLSTREMDKLKACRDSIPERWTSWRLAGTQYQRWTSWRLAGTQYQRDGQAEGLQGLSTREMDKLKDCRDSVPNNYMQIMYNHIYVTINMWSLYCRLYSTMST